MPGLRREEAAMLSGLSVDDYVQLERGNLKGVSESVLNAVANALQLDDAERTHLFDLARAANASGSRPRRPSPRRVRSGLQRVLDAITDAPAWIRNGRADVLAANRLGRALYAPVLARRTPPGSPSSTRADPSSTATGKRPRRTWSPSCARRPAGTPATAG